jgi:DNA repair photolyase
VVTVERRQRKGKVLTPSSLPCLGPMPTINITSGCGMDCVYCYTQSYPSHPGNERVVLYENTPDRVRAELKRGRAKPQRVYFSTASDAFPMQREVQDVTFETMSVLLQHGVEVSFLTKGVLTKAFYPLFRQHPSRVHAQIGISTLRPKLWQRFEPRTASPSQRLRTAARLVEIGVETRARLDPLIPEITDDPDDLAELFGKLRSAGISQAAASYLFTRPAFKRRVESAIALPQLGKPSRATDWSWHRFSEGVGGGRTIGVEERRERLERVAAIAAAEGIEVSMCHCKNADAPGSRYCGIAGTKAAEPTQDVPETLFEPACNAEPW